MLPPKESLPKKVSEFHRVQVELEYLPEDSAASCPISHDDIMEYIRAESADLDAAKAERLKFIRTARVENARYWLWTYNEAAGSECYIFVRERAGGETYLALTNMYGLSPDQYLLAYHHLSP